MQIVLKIKPYTLRATTKDALVSKINSNWGYGGLCMGTYGTYRTTRNGDKLAYSLQKVRSKFERTTKRNKKVNSLGFKTLVSKKLHAGYWEAQVYIFKKEFPIHINQGERTFKINTDKVKSFATNY